MSSFWMCQKFCWTPNLSRKKNRSYVMKWTVGMKIGSGFGLIAAILLIIGTASYRSISKLVDTADWVTHTHKVLENLNGIVLNMVNAETGQRGFAITNDEKYLEPYNYGVGIAEQDLQEVRA